MGEDFLEKSRIRVPYDLEKIVSPEVMACVPKNVRAVVASISYHVAGPDSHYESEIKIHVRTDQEDGRPRKTVRIASLPGPEFVGNQHGIVVAGAKDLLRDVDYLKLILGQYALCFSQQ
ncbi:MAG: hypothetical protein V1702_06540 [Candidatus Woesearchaeota archaeon]